MTVEIKMQGEFDAIEVEGEFDTAIRALEMEATRGNQFVIFENLLGRKEAVKLSNITSIKDAS